jgi:hypothetical protein
MCFSAGASFIGGGIITAVGVNTVIRNSDPDRRLFAAVPLIFGVQQISEGFVWIALQSQGNDVMLTIASYIFLLAAVVIWPSFIPLSVLMMEKSAVKRNALKVFLATGVVTSVYYASGLFMFNIDPQISSHHIKYVNDYPRELANVVFVAYLLATLLPFFVSGVSRMRLLGIFMAASCLVTGIFYKEYLTSVWCFFAAFISGIILWIIIEEEKKAGMPSPENEMQVISG